MCPLVVHQNEPLFLLGLGPVLGWGPATRTDFQDGFRNISPDSLVERVLHPVLNCAEVSKIYW